MKVLGLALSFVLSSSVLAGQDSLYEDWTRMRNAVWTLNNSGIARGEQCTRVNEITAVAEGLKGRLLAEEKNCDPGSPNLSLEYTIFRNSLSEISLRCSRGEAVIFSQDQLETLQDAYDRIGLTLQRQFLKSR